MIQSVSCQPDEVNYIFGTPNIRQCQRYVRSIQRKLDRAVASRHKAKIRFFVHLLSKQSRATKVLAVWKITKVNPGKKTAGVDGVCIPKGTSVVEQDKIRFRLLDGINVQTMPSPIRRVWIDKPNGKKRPLGVPTLADRINQQLIRSAIEPIVEYHFLGCSYGFRPKRGCHDAVADLFNKLSHKGSRRWVVEGDIKGCFDHLKADHILNQLLQWYVPRWVREVIFGMLKSKISHNGEVYDSESGTPQGSVSVRRSA